ncbi:MAG TPA: sigma factor-like helix-turn-helix DNA-binding protein [Tepidisphaeraceae bacterium]|nr:sigma factor-like helix-turn-helix DNA-binding protein [Tepidisphaeraceae bacterium]
MPRPPRVPLAQLLTPRLRLAVVRFNDDRTPAEIAAEFGISRAAAYKRIQRARKLAPHAVRPSSQGRNAA